MRENGAGRAHLLLITYRFAGPACSVCQNDTYTGNCTKICDMLIDCSANGRCRYVMDTSFSSYCIIHTTLPLLAVCSKFTTHAATERGSHPFHIFLSLFDHNSVVNILQRPRRDLPLRSWLVWRKVQRLDARRLRVGLRRTKLQCM
jgi:hypothetical protein